MYRAANRAVACRQKQGHREFGVSLPIKGCIVNTEVIRLDEEPVLKTGGRIERSACGFESYRFRLEETVGSLAIGATASGPPAVESSLAVNN